MAAQISGTALNPQNLISYDLNTSTNFASLTVPLYQNISSGSYTVYIEPNSDIYMNTRDRGNLITSFFSFSTATQAFVGTSAYAYGPLQNKNDFNYFPLITRMSPFTSSAFAIAWNGSIWVAVGSGTSTIASSTDGISWVPRDLNIVFTSGVVLAVTWNGSFWIVVGTNNGVRTNIVATSPDGIIWTGRGSFVLTNGANTQLGRIAWNGSVFLAGTHNGGGYLYTSPDGITWTERTHNLGYTYNIAWNGSTFLICPGPSPGSNILELLNDAVNGVVATYTIGSLLEYGAAWSPTLGIWVVCGSSSPFGTSVPIYYSYNGYSWVGVTIANYIFYDVQWNGTNFVAAGTTYLLYSTTGTTFTTFTHSLGTFYSLAWSPTLNSGAGRWVGFVNGSLYYTNTNNGSSGWTLAANGIFADNALNTVAWSPQLSQFVAVGAAGTNTIAYSYDGITWVGLGATFLTFTAQGAGIVWAPQLGIWCATGYGTNTFLTSTNGINWTPRGTTGVDNIGRAIAWSPQQNQFVMGGSGRHTLATSSGGTLWIGRTGTSIFSTQVNGVVWAAQLNTWVAVGQGTNTIASSQDGISWTPRVPTSLAALTSTGNCVAWNESLFVAGGSGTNQIATSIDGVNWTGRSQAAITGTVLGITWSPGLSLWIATGSTTNTIATSPDGISWTGRGTIFTTQGNGVAWNPQQNQLVACGSGTNTLATSVNGIIWSGMTSPGTIVNNLYSIIWNGQQWLCSGDGNSRLATSPDGLIWTTRTSVQTTTVWGVAWNDSVQLGTTNGGLYVSVGQGSAVFASSPDGITWTTRGSTGISSIGYGICWFAGAGSWVAVGNGTNCIARGTADATLWQGYTGTSIFSTTGWAVAASPNLVVAVGQGTSAIASSPDGITWTQRSAANVIFGLGRGVAYSPTLDIWVAVGSPATHSIAYSRDGLTWIGVTGNTLFSTSGLGVTWNGSFFIAVGQGTNVEATSWDGINWRAGSPPAQGIPYLHCTGTRPAIMVAGGIGTNTLASSWDGGLTWAPRGIGIFTTGCYCVAWNGLIWVAGGAGTNNFATSTDGVNWTGRGTTIITSAVYGIVWAHSLSLWVAVGAGTNTIATSFNGVNWTARNPVTNGLFSNGWANAVAWNGSQFLVTGSGNYSIATSRDGITWSYVIQISPSNGTSAPQSAGIAWNGHVWVLGTSGATVIYSSPDGMNWTTRFNTPSGNGIGSITWNGSLFLATPYRRTDGQYFTSPNGITWTTYTALIDGTINPFATQGIFSAAWNPYTKIWLLCGYDTLSSSNGNMIISNPNPTNAAGWTCRNSLANSVVANNGLYGISWDPGFNRWIGIPFINSVTASGYMVTSPYTGTSWTHRTLVYNATTFINGNAVAYSSTNTCHVAVGSHSTANSSSIIWYSTDGGINWTSVAPTGVTTAIGILRCLVWAPTLNLWVIGGTNGLSTTTNSIIYTSSDIYARSGWTLRSTGIFGVNTANSGMYGVAWNGSNLFVGVGGATSTNIIATSTDGITWTTRGSVPGIANIVHSVCWASNLNIWIAVGVSSSTAAGYGSVNGQSWTASSTSMSGTFYAVATNNRIIVAVGNNGTSSIWYSYTGITWYSVPNANTLFFSTGRSVAWNGSLWVATGQNVNFTATSPDGVNWTAGRVFTTNAIVIGYQNREKTFTISNSHWTGRTSQQTFRILG